MNENCTDAELGRLSRLFLALGEGLEEYTGTALTLGVPRGARVDDVVVGRGAVHIAFHLVFEGPGSSRRACVLLPLRDALGLTGRHRKLDDADLDEVRGRAQPAPEDKDSLLALGRYMASLLAEFENSPNPGQPAVSFVGCQGVRAGMYPQVPREPGEEWLVGRAAARLEPFGEFDLVAMVPPAAKATAERGESCPGEASESPEAPDQSQTETEGGANSAAA
ncbi:MAG: hypothetical protein QF724_03755 [Planctomycetota bacterium]|nr:hypothetical protein [Planctomycetota bacterium]MDP6838029.1 hypothetical protein [Planctomycetota bacterium]MDP6955785.1 hypothetical protein [Planctomycetota bacterium]